MALDLRHAYLRRRPPVALPAPPSPRAPLESSTVAARCILAACRRSIDPVSSSSSPSSNASIVTDVRESSTLAARGLRGAGTHGQAAPSYRPGQWRGWGWSPRCSPHARLECCQSTTPRPPPAAQTVSVVSMLTHAMEPGHPLPNISVWFAVLSDQSPPS